MFRFIKNTNSIQQNFHTPKSVYQSIKWNVTYQMLVLLYQIKQGSTWQIKSDWNKSITDLSSFGFSGIRHWCCWTPTDVAVRKFFALLLPSRDQFCNKKEAVVSRGNQWKEIATKLTPKQSRQDLKSKSYVWNKQRFPVSLLF